MRASDKTRFRLVVLLSLAAAGVYLLATLIGVARLPEELAAVEKALADEPLTTTQIVVGLLMLPVGLIAIAATVGLLRFRHWSRPWAIVATIATLPGYVALGPWIESGVAAAIGDISTMLWGAALAMMYCSPYAELFGEVSTLSDVRDQ